LFIIASILIFILIIHNLLLALYAGAKCE